MNTTLIIKLLRYITGYVFVVSGFMKFINEDLGNFFISLGLPYPVTIMYTVAIVEVICGLLIVFNKYVKLSAISLFVIMIAAFLLTKVPALHEGFFPFAFNARLDIVMLILLYILMTYYNKR